MSSVVSDASPINVLIRIGQIGVLPSLFDSVVIPASVVGEMCREATPAIVRAWIVDPPDWLSIRNPSPLEVPSDIRHRGEQDAIRLAVEMHSDAILLDERKPRLQAMRLGLAVVGTIGILERAADAGMIRDLRAIHETLRGTDFRVSDLLLRQSLARHLARRT